jgi:hypothetical protein
MQPSPEPSVTIERRTVGRVPVLVARSAGAPAPLPLVLWYHGYRAAAEDHRAELTRLAAAGFLAVGVDAVDHGRRGGAALDRRVAAAGGRALPVVLDVARASVAEIPGLVAALATHDGADAARVGLVGISMGGYLAYHAARRLPSLRVVVALLGSPEWPAHDSPHLAPDLLERTALLSVVGERDENVPPHAARRLHARLAARGRSPELSRLVELAGAPHLMGAAHWAALVRETLAWLDRHLGPSRR